MTMNKKLEEALKKVDTMSDAQIDEICIMIIKYCDDIIEREDKS